MSTVIKVNGIALTNARLKANLSMQAVVDAMNDGCNRSSVSRWEQGVLTPSIVRMEKLAELYGTRAFIVVKEIHALAKNRKGAITKKRNPLTAKRNREVVRLYMAKTFSKMELTKIFKMSYKEVEAAIERERERVNGDGE